MAILVIVRGEGFTKDSYEKVRKEVNWEQKRPTGALFHAAGFEKSGSIRIPDVWDSEESFNSFVKTRLQPVMEKHGMTPPKFEIFPAYNINAYDALDKYRPR